MLWENWIRSDIRTLNYIDSCFLKSGGKTKETSTDTGEMMNHDAYKRVKGRIRQR